MGTNKESKKIEGMYRLSRWKSLIALGISLSIMIIFVIAVIREVAALQNDPYSVFRYFTTVSNVLACYGAILTIPFAVEGMRKQTYSVPDHVVRVLFCGTVCVTVTLLLAVFALWPINGINTFRGYNFICHIVCPVLVILLFSLVSGEKAIRYTDCINGVIPFFLYEFLYIVMVILIGKENGGWEDMYGIVSLLPIRVSVPLSVFVVFGITLVFRRIHNELTRKRNKKYVQKIIQRYQPADGADLRFMLFEMGELMGTYNGQNELVVPIELLGILAEHYPEMPLDKMAQVYVQGAVKRIMSERSMSHAKE